MAPSLVPVSGVQNREDGLWATNDEPWLLVSDPHVPGLGGAMVSIVYRSALWDPPARPVFRFLRGEEILSEAIGPAPLEAAAIWTGRVPPGITRLEVSPTNRAGPFGFRVESIRRRSWLALLGSVRLARRPARSALLTRLIGWRPEADNNLAWAIGAHPLEAFEAWAQPRRRPPDPAGIDRPRRGLHETEPFRLVVDGRGDAADVERSLGSLQPSSLGEWQALVVGAPPSAHDRDPRLVSVVTAAEAAARVAADGAWFTVLPAGATLEPMALALVAACRRRVPEASLMYGDEIVDGGPCLKPGWSPRLASALPYLGRAVFASPALFAPAEIEALIEGREWQVPTGVTPVPLRRILLRRRSTGPAAAAAPRPAILPAPAPGSARTAVIMLTRDQPALVTRLVASIRARSAPGSYRLVVVDNSDGEGPARAILAEIAGAPDATVLTRPGPFSFSALCNEAVRASDEPMLLFLNDDMEVLSDGWLDRLVGHASRPDVGAVGARLTYPDGRLQHVGVLAGMGGSAGHFGAPAPGDDPGWAGRNGVLHEVSAVTGACLAVARDKFEAVGGFDAVHLPIELSDVDLCFKLNARGWQTLVDPAVHLMHEESFSRGGATFRRLGKYGDQRAVFLRRWRMVLRDDPVFHPALSLYSWHAALG